MNKNQDIKPNGTTEGLLSFRRGVAGSVTPVSEPTQTAPTLLSGGLHMVTDISQIRFSPRERQVLELLKKGMTASQIGQELGISRRTVEIHKANISRRLNLPARINPLDEFVKDFTQTGATVNSGV